MDADFTLIIYVVGEEEDKEGLYLHRFEVHSDDEIYDSSDKAPDTVCSCCGKKIKVSAVLNQELHYIKGK